jgi:hypothetical protein
MAPNLQHIFITLRGIDASPDATASEDSSDWEELAPELASEPVQIDLMNTSVSGVSPASSLARRATVRADVYRQLRLRLVADQPAAEDPLPRNNECGGQSYNCVVDTNGYTHALAMENGARNVLITSDRIAGGAFNILPDTATQLSIIFDSYSSLAAVARDAVQVMPVFFVETAAPSNSTSSSP